MNNGIYMTSCFISHKTICPGESKQRCLRYGLNYNMDGTDCGFIPIAVATSHLMIIFAGMKQVIFF